MDKRNFLKFRSLSKFYSDGDNFLGGRLIVNLHIGIYKLAILCMYVSFFIVSVIFGGVTSI